MINTGNFIETNTKFINDDEFIFQINTLSSKIKDFFKSTKKGLSNMKSYSETIIDQVLNCKSNISDMFLQLNNSIISTTNPMYFHKPSNHSHFKEKPFKEKLNLIMTKVDKINNMRTAINKDVKFLEQYSNNFYDEAKFIFKKLKQIHSDYSKTIEIEHIQFDEEIINSNSINNNSNHMNNMVRGRINSSSPVKNCKLI